VRRGCQEEEEEEDGAKKVICLSEPSSPFPICYWMWEQPMSGWGGGLPVGQLHGPHM